MSIWAELNRRGVAKTCLAYLASAWLIVQVAATVVPAFDGPAWLVRAAIVAFVIGFPIVIALAWRYDFTADGIQRDRGAKAPVDRHGRMLDFAIIGLLVLTLSVIIVDQYFLEEAASADVDSIAVLPLDNISGDPGQEYFADGMTDALITSLAKIGALKVVSRASVMRYKRSSLSVSDIALRLGVGTILAGTANYIDGRIRISAQLIEASTQRSLWAESYDRNIEDVLALQSDVALDIAREVSIAVTPQEQTRLLTSRRVDRETYESYLRGMYLLNGSTAEDVATGLMYLQQAIDHDPGDALAYAGLAIGYATVAHGIAPPSGVWQRARAAAQRAINLDPDLAEAYLALGNVKLYFEWDFDGARDALERAMTINPNLAMAHYHYAWYLALFGQIDRAIEEHVLARDLDPLTPLHTAWLGSIYSYKGDFQSALDTAEAALEINPNMPAARFVRAAALLALGRPDEAVAADEALAAMNPLWRGLLGVTYALTGNEAGARAIAAELEMAYAEEKQSWMSRDIGIILAALGETSEAARWLAQPPYHAWVPWLIVDPWVKRVLRDEPRYQELVTELDLPSESCCIEFSFFGAPPTESPGEL
jgi:TolB-like protein/Flp pilus assembly protein TadD